MIRIDGVDEEDVAEEESTEESEAAPSSFGQLLQQDYLKYGGIYCLDDHVGEIVCSKKYYLKWHNTDSYVKIFGMNLIKGAFVSLYQNSMEPITNSFNKIQNSDHKNDTLPRCVGLFVHDSVDLS